MNKMILYHGSEKIVHAPQYGVGNPYNDYGLGFYMTEHLEMAKEWACSEEKNGFANQYEFDLTDLSILYLTRGSYHILNWLAILLQNRVFRLNSDLAIQAKKYITENFLIPYEEYDVICGYRADDSYFSFANLFLNNGLSLEKLEYAMLLGELGEQYVLKSEKAFKHIQFQKFELADRLEYYPKKLARDQNARDDFRKEKGNPLDGIYLMDIIREGWKDHDERLQRKLFE